jgi:saccharopine dehydrogenase-like NADP-dependent oxidoreductase
MGPAAAFNAMSDPQVVGVTVCDMDEGPLKLCREKLSGKPGAEKVVYRALDLNHHAQAVAVMREHHAGVAALPRAASLLAIPAVLEAGMPLMDLTRIPDEALAELKTRYPSASGFITLGCGLEPGLTEILARHLAERLDRTDILHIQCGGIPADPKPPLGYKIVFGGKRLPFRASDAYVVEEGRLRPVPRYSGVETTYFKGVGACEAWHEGFMPWLLELDALKRLRTGTQKTVRWPGYAAKVTTLRELGLLSEEPVEVDGVSVIPKHVVDAVLYPHVRMTPEDRDITTFRVEVIGEKNGRPARLRAEMVDHYDERHGFTSMARTTAFTAAIVARMIARRDIAHPGVPFTTPEKILTGAAFETLIKELDAVGIRFDMSEE